jgi:hypothetical protein
VIVLNRPHELVPRSRSAQRRHAAVLWLLLFCSPSILGAQVSRDTDTLTSPGTRGIQRGPIESPASSAPPLNAEGWRTGRHSELVRPQESTRALGVYPKENAGDTARKAGFITLGVLALAGVVWLILVHSEP